MCPAFQNWYWIYSVVVGLRWIETVVNQVQERRNTRFTQFTLSWNEKKKSIFGLFTDRLALLFLLWSRKMIKEQISSRDVIGFNKNCSPNNISYNFLKELLFHYKITKTMKLLSKKGILIINTYLKTSSPFFCVFMRSIHCLCIENFIIETILDEKEISHEHDLTS